MSQAAEAAGGNGSSGEVASEIQKTAENDTASAENVENNTASAKNYEENDEMDAKKDTASAKNDEKDAKNDEKDTESAENVEKSRDSDNEPIRPVKNEEVGNAHPALQNKVDKKKQRQKK